MITNVPVSIHDAGYTNNSLSNPNHIGDITYTQTIRSKHVPKIVSMAGVSDFPIPLIDDPAIS